MPPNMPKAPKFPGEQEEAIIQEPVLPPDYELERQLAEKRMQDRYLKEQERRAMEAAKAKAMEELKARMDENAKISKFTKGSASPYDQPVSPVIPGSKEVKSAFDFESTRDKIEKSIPAENVGSSWTNISKEQGMTARELAEFRKANPWLPR